MLGVSACSTGSFPGLGYLLQAGRGQFQLSFSGRDVAEVLKDPKTSDSLRRLLSEAPQVLAYGVERGLKPTKSYQKYVALEREAAVWVVTASERLAFRSKVWSFPVAGSFHYLGWFDRNDAVEYATRLEAEGWDTDVRGAGAYSTLGWFSDPLLSTMISEGPSALGDWVNVLLHESVHATVFVKGQSSFNESLADFVADRMTFDYLTRFYGADAAETRAWRELQERSQARGARLHEAYSELNRVYENSLLSAEAKVEAKDRIFAELSEQLKWKRRMTNATLIGFKTYQSGNRGLESLLTACGGDLLKMLHTVGKWDPQSFPKSQVTDQLDEFLEEQAKRGC
jgi:predicted aminopeptidase